MNTQQKIQYLRQIRSVIERGWTQGAAARDARGHGCSSMAEEARSWCLLGAEAKAWNELGRPSGEIYLYELFGVHGIAAWNDEPGRTQEEVLGLLDDTIQRLEKELVNV